MDKSSGIESFGRAVCKNVRMFKNAAMSSWIDGAPAASCQESSGGLVRRLLRFGLVSFCSGLDSGFGALLSNGRLPKV